MSTVYLSLGSNNGDRAMFLSRATAFIANQIGPISGMSDIYENESWGFKSHPFLNQVVRTETNYSPKELLKKIKAFEAGNGRQEKNDSYQERNIDIDILFYDNEIIQDRDLIIPHKHIQSRLFVLLPLKEINKNYTHPVLKMTVDEMIKQTDDQSWIKKYNH